MGDSDRTPEYLTAKVEQYYIGCHILLNMFLSDWPPPSV